MSLEVKETQTLQYVFSPTEVSILSSLLDSMQHVGDRENLEIATLKRYVWEWLCLA